MGTNGFREEELVSRRVKVGNEWQIKIFPIVAGRLRLAHEENQNLSLQTELVNWDGQYAVFKCCAVTVKGQFIGYGTANNQRDERLAESLVELAETRSIARALRFAGYGMEYTSAEEVSHVPATEQNSDKAPAPVFAEGNGNGKKEAKAPSGAPAEPASKEKSGGNGSATQAQVRALFALSRKANYQEVDMADMLTPFEVSRFEDLSRQDASQLIGQLQTQVAA